MGGSVFSRRIATAIKRNGNAPKIKSITARYIHRMYLMCRMHPPRTPCVATIMSRAGAVDCPTAPTPSATMPCSPAWRQPPSRLATPPCEQTPPPYEQSVCDRQPSRLQSLPPPPGRSSPAPCRRQSETRQ